jgi:hypothetical protein
VGGATGRYTSPARYLVLWAAVGAVVYLQLGWITGSGTSGSLAAVREYLALVLVARVPFALLLSLMLFRRAGLNLAEHPRLLHVPRSPLCAHAHAHAHAPRYRPKALNASAISASPRSTGSPTWSAAPSARPGAAAYCI